MHGSVVVASVASPRAVNALAKRAEKDASSAASARRRASSRRSRVVPRVVAPSMPDQKGVAKNNNREPSEDVIALIRSSSAVAFDVDSTVCVDEGIDELAAFLGKGDEVAAMTAAAMGGGVYVTLSVFESNTARSSAIASVAVISFGALEPAPNHEEGNPGGPT